MLTEMEGFLMQRMLLAGFVTAVLMSAPARAEVPDAIAVPGEMLVVRLHAEGAQVYDCEG